MDQPIVTDYCDHLHYRVTQRECAGCWLGMRADPDYAVALRDALRVKGHLWDECRRRHIGCEADEGRA